MTLDDPIRRQMADRGYTLVPRRTHRYAGENLAVCGAAVPDPCPECAQSDVEALRDRIALSFADGRPEAIDEKNEWWTTPRALADEAVAAIEAEVAQPDVEALREVRDAAQARELAEERLADWDVAHGYVINSDRDHLDGIRSEAVHALRAALDRLDRQETTLTPPDGCLCGCQGDAQPDEVRDAALALVDEWDMTWSDDHPLRSHYLTQAQDRLRAALDRPDR